jgi:hypothetical protein
MDLTGMIDQVQGQSQRAQSQSITPTNQAVGALQPNIAVDQAIQPAPVKMGDAFQATNPSSFQPINEAFTGRAGATTPIPTPSNELGTANPVFKPSDMLRSERINGSLSQRQGSIGAYGEQFTNKY